MTTRRRSLRSRQPLTTTSSAGDTLTNANPQLPLQFDTHQLVNRILRTISETATAGRTLAAREEDRIYCWYEGWLPEEEKLPTAEWTHAWIDSGLLRGTYPAATIAQRPVIATPLIPRVDPSHPDVIARIRETRPAP